MDEAAATRRLTAIMFTDVVGAAILCRAGRESPWYPALLGIAVGTGHAGRQRAQEESQPCP